MSTHLEIGEKPGIGIRRLLLQEMEAALGKLQSKKGASKEEIHLFRKHCKRLRALLRLARPVLGGDFEKEQRLIRDLAREVSGARDYAVMAETLQLLNVASPGEVRQVQESITHKPDIGKLRKKLEKAILRMKKRRFSRLDGKALWWAFSMTLKRMHGEWKQICRKPSDHTFHNLRRWANYYRHQLAVLELAKPKKTERILKRFAKLIEAIGKAHDLQVLRENLDPASAHSALARRIDKAELRRLETAFQVGARIFDLRHGALPRGMKKRVKLWG